ncbi:BTB and MATH domain-containing protein 42-like [Drosophila subpulchrella]|uniref:BTB and MATH domain-containing protein 42-like n=1 Tax=Drosophila subpulchrella TaxID=1486046 RepID=UPI0018A17A0F|nr:BTB and MATH domain-containing protein 42-like [Drosophila subpulchrella]
MDPWLAKSFQKLRAEEDFADCSVIVGTQTFRCHKVILGVASDFFKRAFQPGFAEAKTGELPISNVTADVFIKFLDYVYSYEEKALDSYSNTDIIKLKECANMWMVESLKEACDVIIGKRIPNMFYGDLLLYFEHAHHVDDLMLVRDISSALRQKISGIAIPETLYELGSDVFREFLNTIKGRLTERRRYDMVEKYVAIHGFVLNQSELNKWQFHGLANQIEKNPDTSHLNNNKPFDYANPNPFKVEKLNFSETNPVSLDPRSKKINSEYVKDLLSLIDYMKMTADEFFEGPGKSKMMTFEDKFNFMYKIARRKGDKIFT